MKEKIQLLAAALALILLLCGCAARGTASNDAKPAAGDVTGSNAAPYEVPAFRDSVFNEDEATAFGSGEIDLSQLEGGNRPGVESYKKNMFALLGKPGYENLTAELEAKLK